RSSLRPIGSRPAFASWADPPRRPGAGRYDSPQSWRPEAPRVPRPRTRSTTSPPQTDVRGARGHPRRPPTRSNPRTWAPRMRRDGLSEIDRPRGGEPGDLTLRRLGYGDLPSVISIERRSFPTPWSLAMFVLELSKPSGICLAAEDRDGLVGYLVCARYDDV